MKHKSNISNEEMHKSSEKGKRNDFIPIIADEIERNIGFLGKEGNLLNALKRAKRNERKL